jgi:hypothetical protein
MNVKNKLFLLLLKLCQHDEKKLNLENSRSQIQKYHHLNLYIKNIRTSTKYINYETYHRILRHFFVLSALFRSFLGY